MRHALVALLIALGSVSTAAAQVSVGVGLPGVSIGINLPVFPELVVVPNYPVYYAPRGDVNLFFYDGLYWAYQRDNWYASSWYNGPWGLVGPEGVPAFILRIPVRYYRHPPASWVGWRSDAPPRWGERWGHEWEQRRSGWDQWDRRTARAPAPLPVYQRQYSGDRYPRVEQQQALHREKYRYQPQDPVARQQYQRQGAQPQPAEHKPRANQRPSAPPSPQQVAPAVSRSEPRRGGGEGVQSAPVPVPAVQRQPPRQAEPTVIHERSVPKTQGHQERAQGKGDAQQQQHGPEQGQERGQGHNK